MVRDFGGAYVRRVIDRSNASVPEHAHEWPVLSIFVLGGYSNETELGTTLIAGPSAVLYQAGAAHRNLVGASGFEQVEIEFDPDWLGRALIPLVPVSQWLGGSAGADSRTLARLCAFEDDGNRLRAALRKFMQGASSHQNRIREPVWMNTITRCLSADATVSVDDLARKVGRHPSWLGTAYRRASGEGLAETAARLRVERAARLLRETDQAGADIAHEAGFCDQSHMNRTFRRLLGRLPSAVRNDRTGFRQQPAFTVSQRNHA
jgi:AraC family transcriptional regulator